MTQIDPTVPAGRPEPGRSLLELDPASFRQHFPGRPFLIGHHLMDHPLFSLARLVELARRLPAASVEYNAGDVPVNLAVGPTPRTGLSVEETIRRIEEHRSWMVLKWVEADPEYRALLDRCLDEVERLSEPLAPGMLQRQGFIFISSQESVTPYHMDHEHNFLLQVRGGKTVSLFDPGDRQVLSEREIEAFYSGAHRNLVFREEYQARARRFELGPGVGLHFPVNAPHHVRTRDQVSISFSITFRTPAIQRRSAVYAVNGRLRRLGLAPLPYGRSPLRDAAKFQAYRVLARAGRLLGRS